MTKTEAYLLGAHLGDGHASRVPFDCPSSKGVAWNFVLVSIDQDVVERFAQCIRDRFNLSPVVSRQRDSYYHVRCNRKEIVTWAVELTRDRKHLPESIWTAAADIKKEFVSGLMDTDGWITENTKRSPTAYQMGIASTSPWVFELRRLLQKSEVICRPLRRQWQNPKHSEWAPCHRMYINLRSFCESGHYFQCIRKQDRLQRYQSQVLGWKVENAPSETTRQATH